MPEQSTTPGLPFYDPLKSYEENFSEGPFGAFATKNVYKNLGAPKESFLGLPVYSPFGIAAGPLINSKFMKAALDKGFDIVTYKTVRSRRHYCHPWPNVLSVHVDGKSLNDFKNPLLGDTEYGSPLSITNSFGVPSFDPEFWQQDMASCVEYAQEGQVVIGSFQGTKDEKGDALRYIDDFGQTAKLVAETKVPILEVNLSCPNEGTNNLLCFDVERTRLVVESIRKAIGNKPLIVKIAYFQDFEVLRRLVQFIGSLVNGIEAINTILAPIVDKTGQPALPGEGRTRSGVCGAGIQWAGLEMTQRLKKLREELGQTFTIIGVGGVMTAEDYSKYKQVGADAVMSATGAMWNPFLAQEIKNSLYN